MKKMISRLEACALSNIREEERKAENKQRKAERKVEVEAWNKAKAGAKEKKGPFAATRTEATSRGGGG